MYSYGKSHHFPNLFINIKTNGKRQDVDVKDRVVDNIMLGGEGRFFFLPECHVVDEGYGVDDCCGCVMCNRL